MLRPNKQSNDANILSPLMKYTLRHLLICKAIEAYKAYDFKQQQHARYYGDDDDVLIYANIEHADEEAKNCFCIYVEMYSKFRTHFLLSSLTAKQTEKKAQSLLENFNNQSGRIAEFEAYFSKHVRDLIAGIDIELTTRDSDCVDEDEANTQAMYTDRNKEIDYVPSFSYKDYLPGYLLSFFINKTPTRHVRFQEDTPSPNDIACSTSSP